MCWEDLILIVVKWCIQRFATVSQEERRPAREAGRVQCLSSTAGRLTFVPWLSNNTTKLDHGVGSINDCATNRTVGKSNMFFDLPGRERERERERGKEEREREREREREDRERERERERERDREREKGEREREEEEKDSLEKRKKTGFIPTFFRAGNFVLQLLVIFHHVLF